MGLPRYLENHLQYLFKKENEVRLASTMYEAGLIGNKFYEKQYDGRFKDNINIKLRCMLSYYIRLLFRANLCHVHLMGQTNCIINTMEEMKSYVRYKCQYYTYYVFNVLGNKDIDIDMYKDKETKYFNDKNTVFSNIGWHEHINIFVYNGSFIKVSRYKMWSHNTKKIIEINNGKLLNLLNQIDREQTINAIKYRVFNQRSFPEMLKHVIFHRDNFECKICGKHKDYLEKDNHLEVDHIHEWEDGGLTTYKNGQTVCAKCNKGKHHAKKYLAV